MFMKKTAAVLLMLMTVFAVLTAFSPEREKVSADETGTAQDVIEDYTITVDVNDDGSLNMDYSITWHIISNGNEGPLTWVKIGVPNSNVSHIKAQSDNIKKIGYYKDSYGEYIKITFNQAYSDGDTFTFRYTFTQYNMFDTLPKMNPTRVQYWFRPGWFNNIEVRNITVRWEADKVKEIAGREGELIDGYYVWTGSLAPGELFHVVVIYDIDALNFREHQSIFHFIDTIDTIKDNKFYKICISLGFVAVLCVLAIIKNKYRSDNPYYHYVSAETDNLIARLHGENIDPNHKTRKRGSDYSDYGNGGGFDGGGSSCACACACACAGGGRAGCSAKDFYGTKLESSRVREKLRQKAKEESR